MTTLTADQEAQNAGDARTIVDKINASALKYKTKKAQSDMIAGNAHYALQELGSSIDNLTSAIGMLGGWGLKEITSADRTQLVSLIARQVDVASWVAASFSKLATNYYDHEAVASVLRKS